MKTEWTEAEVFFGGQSFGKVAGAFELLPNDSARWHRAARNKAKARRRRWRKKNP